jgi:hypothetical protein
VRTDREAIVILLVPIICTLLFFALVVWLVPKLDPPAVRAARRRGRGYRFWNGPFHTWDEALRDQVAKESVTAEGNFARLMKRRYDMIEFGRFRRDD